MIESSRIYNAARAETSPSSLFSFSTNAQNQLFRSVPKKFKTVYALRRRRNQSARSGWAAVCLFFHMRMKTLVISTATRGKTASASTMR